MTHLSVRSLLLGMLWLLCSHSTLASIMLPEGSFDYPINNHVSFFEDPSNSLDIDSILNRENQLRFTPNHSNSIKFGISQSTHWLRFTLRNPYNFNRTLVLALSRSNFESATLYHIDSPTKVTVISEQDPSRHPVGSFQQMHTQTLIVPANTTQSYLIRFKAEGLINTSLNVQSPDKYVAKEQRYSMLQGVSYGLVLVAILLAAYIAWVTGLYMAKLSVYYGLSTVLYMLAMQGLLQSISGLSWQLCNTLGLLAAITASTIHALSLNGLLWLGPARQHMRWSASLMACFLGLCVFTTLLIEPLFVELALTACVLLISLCSLILLLLKSTAPLSAQRWLMTGHLLIIMLIPGAMLSHFNFLDVDNSWIPILMPSSILVSLLIATMVLIQHHQQLETRAANRPFQSSALLKRISQELRTPISSVMGMSELLNNTPLNPEQREYNYALNHAGHSLWMTSNTVADLAQLHAGDLLLEKQSFALPPLLTRYLNYFQLDAHKNNIEMMLEMSDDFPSHITTDPIRLQSLLFILMKRTLMLTEHGQIILYASRFSGQSQGIRIQMHLHSSLLKQDELRQTINMIVPQSNSIPIATEDWELLLARTLINRFNATVEIESLTHQGASATLYLPLDQMNEHTEAPVTTQALTNKRLLIVDDNAALRAILDRQTKRWSMRPDTTYSGKEALAMLRNQCHLEQPYHAIIIDQDMPIMDGLQLAQRLQQDADINPKPLVILLTSQSPNVVLNAAERADIAQVLTKPVDNDALYRALQSLC